MIAGDYDVDDMEITQEEAHAHGWDDLHKWLKPNGMVKCNLYTLCQVRFREISEWVARDFNKFIEDESMSVEWSPPNVR